MEVVNSCEGRYERRESLSDSTDNEDSSNSNSSFESNDNSSTEDQESQSIATDNNTDLKKDLQKSVAQYKSDSNLPLQTASSITNDEDFQAAALCQFMDVLNDLDEVLDKSLLACLDDPKAFDSDEEDLVCKSKEFSDLGATLYSGALISIDDNTNVICGNDYYQRPEPSAPPLSLEYDVNTYNGRPAENIPYYQNGHQKNITSTTDQDRSQGTVAHNLDKSQGPITTDQDALQGPITTDQDTSQGPITTDQDTSQGPITTDQDTSQGPITTDQDKSQGPITTDQNTSQGTITINQDRSQGTITNNQDRFQQHITTNLNGFQEIPTNNQDRSQGTVRTNKERLQDNISYNQDRSQGTITANQDRSQGTITTHQDSSQGTITTHQDSAQGFITTHQDSGTITTHQDSAQGFITTHQDSAQRTITTHQDSSQGTITTDQDRLQGTITTNQDRSQDTITTNQDRLQGTITTNQDRSQGTTTTDQERLQDNISYNQYTSQGTITTHQDRSQGSITTNQNRSQDYSISERSMLTLGRSKSFTDLSTIQRQTLNSTFEIASMSTTNDTLRNSMQRLDPIVLPTMSVNEPLTLPVILFLEHNTTSPIQVQVTAANLTTSGSSGPLIVGRRALLMNRALSLPSPVESDMTEEYTGRNTARSTGRSSSSSSSSESLAGVLPVNQTFASAAEESVAESDSPPFGVWPHRMSAMLACLSCTVGVFNISRFATFSVHFGASFIVQFFILSFLIGIPLFTLYLCLGQVLESGPVDMWRISPIFQGVGISMLITQAVIGMYSIIGLSWIFVYFRDSFISMDDRYKWALPCEYGTEDGAKNITYKIQETLPQYFHGEVLQRNYGSNGTFGTIKFQVAFNLAVVWMIVFVALSKGLRSYGKAVYMLIFLPICGTLVLCTKLLTLIPYDSVTNIFSETEWSEFFINSNSWAAATQETFLTWGLLGACIMQLTSHKNAKNKTNAMLQKESACIISFTFAILLLSSFLANTCVQILKNHGYYYIPGSYETLKSSQFLWPISEPLPGNQVSTPVRYMNHYGSLVGVTVWRSSSRGASGWQPLQLATQLVPATLAVLPNNVLSPAWAVIFYFVLITFGLAQQLAIWHCVVAGVLAINPRALRVWETTITFLGCVLGLACSLMLTTDAGIKIVHFIDYVWVGSWWHCAVQVALACGVFVVRGRPYSPDAVVAALYNSRSRLSATLAALLSFTWTVILPVLLCAICVMDFRVGQQRQLYNWRKNVGYWPVWARQVAVLMQQVGLLSVPVTAFVQTWRYMSKGPPDILERIQNLYRPHMELPRSPPPRSPAAAAPPRSPRAPPAPDPPPKYTPPPSYSTATGARLLNTIRRSFRTLRRITTTRAELSSQAEDSHAPITLSETVDHNSLESQPPQYTSGAFPTFTISDEVDAQQPLRRTSMSLTRDYLRRSFVRKSDSIKSIRSSLRRNFKFGNPRSTSNEQLVRDAEPISNTVAMSAMLDGENSLQDPSAPAI